MTDIVLLGGYDAKRCARRIHNEWDPTIEKNPWEIPAELQMRLDAGNAFETEIFEEIKELTPAGDLVDLSADRGKVATIAATASAMDAEISVILGGWLPDDKAGGRTGRPDVLLHMGGGLYVPGDVKAHKVVAQRATGTLTYSLLSELAEVQTVSGFAAETTARFDDYLQVAHYWRMLKSSGRVPPGSGRGFIVGSDRPGVASGMPIATWLDLEAPLFQTYSRSSGTKKRSALERYDHEHDFRLQVAQTAVEGLPALVQPIFTDECGACPWTDYCQNLVGEDVASRHITSGRLSVREWKTLADAGIVDLGELADLDIADNDFQSAYLPEVTNIRDPLGRLATAVRRARMSRDGVTLERESSGPVNVPRADIEIDFDIEWDPEDHVYLWGALVSQMGHPPRYEPVVSFDDLDGPSAVNLAERFVAWLRNQIAEADTAGRSLLVYHYAQPEPTYLKRALGEQAVADLTSRFVDLLPIVRKNFFGLHGLGIKNFAPAFGFNWRDEEPGGLQSQLWLLEARGAGTDEQQVAAQRRILQYNEDDVRATLALRIGLDSLPDSLT